MSSSHESQVFDGYSCGTEDVMAKADARGKLKRVYNAEEIASAREG